MFGNGFYVFVWYIFTCSIVFAPQTIYRIFICRRNTYICVFIWSIAGFHCSKNSSDSVSQSTQNSPNDCVMFTFGSGSYSIEFYILLPLFFYVFLPFTPRYPVYVSRCLPTYADCDQFVYRTLCWTSISKRYTYWLSLIKGSSNFYRFVCTSISFSFSITTSTATLRLLFDARSMVQSQYKSSHVMNWWLCERMRHFWRASKRTHSVCVRECADARACVCVCMQ